MDETQLSHGVDVNFKKSDRQTALSMALEKGHQDVAALLRAHGAIA